jgi:LysR family transcriptional regulator, hydrogen peroxide-inducible genes activator
MNLRDLRYLVAVADHRHFGKAAEACFVSQPTLSTQIKKLEKELGVELIERNPRHIMLTETGERVVERARIVLGETDNIERIARQAQDPESGSIRMGLFPTLAPYLLPHVVPNVHRRFPNLELLLVEEKTEVVHQRLRAGTLDVGVLARPVHDDQLHEEVLFDEEFVLAVPSDHPLAASGAPVDLSVLATENVLLLEEGHCLRDQALAVCQLAGAEERSGFRATSLETLRQMVAAGVGVTLLPALAVQHPVATSDDIALLHFAGPVPRRQISMFWRRTSVLGAFLPTLADVLRDLPSTLDGVRPVPAIDAAAVEPTPLAG